MLNFIENFLFKIDLKVVSIMKRKLAISLILRVGLKLLKMVLFLLLMEVMAISDITIDNIQDKCYFIGDQANTNNFITEFDFRFGPYFVPNKVGTNKKADYNDIRGNNGQDTDKAVRVLLLGGGAHYGSSAGSGFFYSNWVRSGSLANVGFFTTVKLD